MVNRNKILSQFFRTRTWVAVLIAMQMVFVIPMTSDETEAITWDSPYIVASGSVLTQMAMAVEGDNVYCVYVQDNRGIYSVVMRWYDGSSWSSMLTVSLGTSTDAQYPDIAVSNGTAHITYVDQTDRDADVMYRSYNGSYFTIIQQVSNTRGGENAYDPAIAADGDHVFIVWEEITVSDWDIHYRYIFEGRLGVTSALSTDIANDRQADPAIAMDDGKAHVVWTDDKNGDSDIYYRMWNGATWTGEVDLIPFMDRNNQEYPDIDVEGDDVYVVYRHMFGSNNYGINMVTYTNLRWGTPNGVPGPSGTEHLPRLGVEAGHVALVYLNIDRYYSAYFQLYDGQSWEAPEALETGDIDHIYWPSSVELLNGRAHAMVYDENLPSKIHRYYVGDVDETEPSAEVAEVSPYWMESNRLSLAWSASDDYGLESVTVQYRYSKDKETWDRWTVVDTIDTVEGTVASGIASFSALDGEGFYEFKAWAMDISGRSEAPTTEPEAEAALDQTPPTASLLINDGDEYTTDSHVSLNLSYSDVMTDQNGSSGRSEYTVEVSNDGLSWTEITAPGNKHAWDLTSGEGAKRVHLRVTDAAGLVSAIFTDSIIVDLTDPNMTLEINEGDEWTNSRDVSLSITYEEAIGVAGMRVSNEAIGGDEPWENPVDTMPWTLPEGEGMVTIYYQVMDNASRTSEVHSTSISLDTVAPTGSIIVEGGDTLTTERMVTLTLTYEDATSGVSKVRFMDEAVGGDEPWDNPVETKEWDLGTESGLVTIYYQVQDVSGLVSEIYSVSVTLDVDDPTGSIIMGGSDTLVNTPTVELALTYDDATSSIVGIRVTNEAVGGDEPWDNPVETLTWELSAGDGEKTIYYQVLDEAGRESQVYTLSITLDSSNPYVDTSDPEDAATDEKVTVNIVVRFSKAMNQTITSDATSMSYVDADGNTVTVAVNFSWSPDSMTMTIEPRSDLKHSTEYTWAITTAATDAAGNELFPAIQYTLTTEKGDDGGNGGDDNGDDGALSLLVYLVVFIVGLMVIIVLSVFYMHNKGGPGVDGDVDDL